MRSSFDNVTQEDITVAVSDQQTEVNGIKAVIATSLGTVFEWYEFYLYGSLTAVFTKQFFTGVDPSIGFVFVLLAFAAGFVVRPFGALFFGRLGDTIGRKATFVATITLMGFSTFLIGMLPNYAIAGVLAPALLVILRMLQGLALGGEYGGAVAYVAEYAPEKKRGAYTAWVQITATLGLCLSVLVLTGLNQLLGEEAMASWGWRIPFLLALPMTFASLWLRLSMDETPFFEKAKAKNQLSRSPLKDSLGNWTNGKKILISLFGLTAGQAVVWYAGQFYALFFLINVLKVDVTSANTYFAIGLALGIPFILLAGYLSDRVGRKPLIMLGLALAAITYIPVFKALTYAANPALYNAQETAKMSLVADPDDCSFQFNPTGTKKFTSSCDIAKQILASSAVSYDNVAAPAGTIATIRIQDQSYVSYDSTGLATAEAKTKDTAFRASVGKALGEAGYPKKADMEKANGFLIVCILVYLVSLVGLVYGPIAALLAETFHTRVRYTSLSVPYHIGNGWFGGLLPTTAFAIIAQTGNIYNGLWYPIVVASVTLVIGLIFVKETNGQLME